MHDDLVFLATSRTSGYAGGIDKYLDGYFTLQFMTQASGPVEVAFGERSWTLEGDWFWPAFPGVRTRFHAAAPGVTWFHRHVGFQGPLVGRWQAQGLWPDAPQSLPGEGEAAQLRDRWVAHFDEIIHLVRRGDLWGRKRAINLIENLLLQLAEARHAPALKTRENAWLSAVLDELEKAQSGGASLDYAALSHEMGVSLSVLRRRFRAATGVPLHDWVLRGRVAKARTLLLESDLPLKAIAAQLGYDNVYFFARQFKKIAGVAPGALRKSRL